MCTDFISNRYYTIVMYVFPLKKNREWETIFRISYDIPAYDLYYPTITYIYATFKIYFICMNNIFSILFTNL